MLTVKQAAEKLGISANLVYSLCAARKLRHTRVGLGRGKIRIFPEAIDEYLASRTVGPPEKPVPPPPTRPKLRHLRSA